MHTMILELVSYVPKEVNNTILKKSFLFYRNHLFKLFFFFIINNLKGDFYLRGRLLPVKNDMWVHCNCALWSSEVGIFEENELIGMY